MDRTEAKKLPHLDLLLSHPDLLASGLPQRILRTAAQAELDALRAAPGPCPDLRVILHNILRRALDDATPTLAPVVNATGVVLHPQLGRAPLSDAALSAMTGAGGSCALEYDLDTGRATDRAAVVEALLKDLTGAEDALVVNNNAAALLLSLTALAQGKGVALSRGELAELGGGLRIPDLMEQSGCALVEVGSTNRTCQTDYRAVLESGKAQFLLKVYISNFKMVGFTQDTSLTELVGLGRAYGYPVLCDLGAGALLPARQLGLEPELPSAAEAVRAGVDVVCFSGDKLLGGPQAGILVGRSWAVEALKKHPLLRALRPDKITLAALEATLRLYREPKAAQKELPTLSMLAATRKELQGKATALAQALERLCGKRCAVAVEKGMSHQGGDSLLGGELPTALVTLTPSGQTAQALAAALRQAPVPVVALVQKDKVVLDARTLREGDDVRVVKALEAALDTLYPKRK